MACRILAVIPGIPNVSVLRTFRVLRPLRSLNAVAGALSLEFVIAVICMLSVCNPFFCWFVGIKKLVTSLLKSIPELLTVVVFLLFLFFLYGVIGIQLWSGVLHSRCRLTPYPIRLDANLTYETFPSYQEMVLSNISLFKCLDEENGQIPLSDSIWTHDSSPWKNPRMCFWPIAEESTKQTCAISEEQHRLCPSGQVHINFSLHLFNPPHTAVY